MRKLLPALIHFASGALALAGVYGPLPWWCAVVAAIAWYVLIGPAMVYAQSTRALEVPPYEVLPSDAQTTAGSDQWAQMIAAQLAPLGFVPRARYRLPGPGGLDFGQRLDNASTGEVAVIVAGWNQPPDGPATPLRLAVFHTCFRDGGELVTTNSPLPAMTPDLPGQLSYRMPAVADVATLYAVHRRLVKADARRPRRIVLSDDPLVWELEQNRRAVAVQIAHGLGVRDDKAGVLRLTLKGALRGTWLLHPLLAGWQNRRSSAAATAALRAAAA